MTNVVPNDAIQADAQGYTPEEMAALMTQRQEAAQEADENETQDEPEITQEAAAEEAEVSGDETDAEEAEGLEASAEESETEDAEEEQAEARFESLAELAEAAEVPIEEFLQEVKTTVKVQGESSEVNLADLIKGYQLESTFTRKNEAFLNRQKEWEAERESEMTRLNDEFKKAGTAFAMAQEQLTHEYAAIDWNELQVKDPQQFLIKRQQFGERQAQLNQAVEQATQHAQYVYEAQEAEKEQKKAENIQRENELLLEKLPSWQDESVRKVEAQAVGEYLVESGFTPDEIPELNDHRIILLAKKAMQVDKVATQTEVSKKKIANAPKLVKKSAKPQVNANERRKRQLRAQLKKTGDASYAAQLMNMR